MESENESVQKVSRREFLKASSAAFLATGFFLGFNPFLGVVKKAEADSESIEFSPSVYLAITPDNVIRIVCHRSEIGQGARTSMPMLIAEELEVDWKNVQVVQAIGDVKYGDQNTDGSTSVRINWEPLRKVGATAREMLLEAAARTWKVPKAQCTAENGMVVHPSGKKATYGELAKKAATLPVPKDVPLKDPKHFKVIGTPKKFVDLQDITVGKAKFGIDSEMPGMVYAVLLRSPTLAGKIKSYDAGPVLKQPGVRKVVKMAALPQDINTFEALAVIGDHTYAAINGAKSLQVEWDPGPGELESTESKKAEMIHALSQPGKPVREEGSFSDAIKKAKKTITATYFAPYLVHAQMEPPNALAYVHDGKCEVWAPTQSPQRARSGVAKYLGIKDSDVTINVSLVGGGFGRKSQPDFILEAVVLSKELGKPVKVMWTRENDIQSGFYHAISMQKLTAGLDAKKEITAWEHKSSFPTLTKVFNPKAFDPAPGELGQGLMTMPYRIPNVRCTANPVGSQVRVAWLRSVCNIFHSFGINSFIDEIAARTKQDPVALRLKLLGAPRVLEYDEREKKGPYKQDTGRLANVIRQTAKLSGWKKRKLPKNHGIGFASHYSFFSYVAVAIEVEVKNSQLKIVRADCVADCGIVVNPDTVKAQLEGAILFGLSLAALGEIGLEKGAVIQSNFHNYPIVRLNQAPLMKIELVTNMATPTGIGEPGTPPVAPALVNAIFNATGKAGEGSSAG